MAEYIRIKQLTKRYSGAGKSTEVLALADLDCAVSKGEFLCILGRSGCGKSTLLNILAGLDGDFMGRVTVRDMTLRPRAAPPYRVGYVFQDPRLLPWFTVRKNIEFALQAMGIPKAEWRDRVTNYLSLVGLAGFEDAYPNQLSGGMRQRAAIGRAWAVDPDVLLMDEPFSGLDELTAREMRSEVIKVWLQSNKTIVFVTHNPYEAAFLADRILIMTTRPGRIEHEVSGLAPRAEQFDAPTVLDLAQNLISMVTDRPYKGNDKIVSV